jgi:hypothetical protein
MLDEQTPNAREVQRMLAAFAGIARTAQQLKVATIA